MYWPEMGCLHFGLVHSSVNLSSCSFVLIRDLFMQAVFHCTGSFSAIDEMRLHYQLFGLPLTLNKLE